MVDLPLVYEDTAFLGDIVVIQGRVPCCAEEGKRSVSLRGRKAGHVFGSYPYPPQ